MTSFGTFNFVFVLLKGHHLVAFSYFFIYLFFFQNWTIHSQMFPKVLLPSQTSRVNHVLPYQFMERCRALSHLWKTGRYSAVEVQEPSPAASRGKNTLSEQFSLFSSSLVLQNPGDEGRHEVDTDIHCTGCLWLKWNWNLFLYEGREECISDPGLPAPSPATNAAPKHDISTCCGLATFLPNRLAVSCMTKSLEETPPSTLRGRESSAEHSITPQLTSQGEFQRNTHCSNALPIKAWLH